MPRKKGANHRDITRSFDLAEEDVEQILRARTATTVVQLATFVRLWKKREQLVPVYADALGIASPTAHTYFNLLIAALETSVADVVDGVVTFQAADRIAKGKPLPEDKPLDEETIRRNQAKASAKHESQRERKRLSKEATLEMLDTLIQENFEERGDRKEFAILTARKSALEGMDAPEVQVKIDVAKMLGPRGVEGIDHRLADRVRLLRKYGVNFQEFMQQLPSPEPEEAEVSDTEEPPQEEAAAP